MTREDVIEILAVVGAMWPHSKIGDPETAVGVWHGMLAEVPRGDVEAAIKDLAGDGREHAPPVGVVVQAVALRRQGPPPSAEDAHRWLSRQMGKRVAALPNRPWVVPQGVGPDATATAIAHLAGQPGVHEAVLRWVAAEGVESIRLRLPDPELVTLDPNQLADRRDKLRGYEQRVVPEWRRDPTPGRALERACARAGLSVAEMPMLTPSAEPVRRRALPAPAGQEPLEEGPFIGPGEVLAAYEAASAEREREREAERLRLVEARRADAERRRAALAELAKGGETA